MLNQEQRAVIRRYFYGTKGPIVLAALGAIPSIWIGAMIADTEGAFVFLCICLGIAALWALKERFFPDTEGENEYDQQLPFSQCEGLGLYVHIPFCVKKCFYCDFLSFRALAADHEAYVDQLVREIRARGAFCSELTVSTVFIGGGTPTVMEPELIRRIMEAVKENFTLEPDAEITIEANPGTLLYNKLPVYHDCGINRVSIGLQSADNQELKNLGRVHSFEEFLKSYQSARMSGFTNISVDLMSGIPGQTLESWKNTLKKVTMLKPEHISAYSLIIEQGTPFWEQYGPGMGGCRRENVLPLPDEDTENRIYHLTRDFLGEMGYQRYEISNYAKPGKECRHNIG